MTIRRVKVNRSERYRRQIRIPGIRGPVRPSSRTTLFPGHRAGQPLQPRTPSPLIHELGVATTAARTAPIGQHMIDMPAPLVATTLDYHQITAARLGAQAGTTWPNYARSDHGG